MLSELQALLRDTLIARWQAEVPEVLYNEVLTNLAERKISPGQALMKLLDMKKESAAVPLQP